MWKPKVDDDGKPVLQDGMPVFMDDSSGDSTETAFDPNKLEDRIRSLKGENMRRREQNEKLETQLEHFKDIEDPEKFKADALDAMEKVKNLKDKDLKVAERTEKIKKEIKEAYEDQVKQLKDQFTEREKELQNESSTKDDHIYSLMVSNRFAQSNWFAGENPATILPPDVGESYFGKYFRVVSENGGKPTLRAYNKNGEPIQSRKNMGELADFDEAMEILINNHPNKERLLRSSEGGSGGSGGTTNQAGRTPLEKLKKQYTEAEKNNDADSMISLKNKIYELEKTGI